jgi:hypothetical protein
MIALDVVDGMVWLVVMFEMVLLVGWIGKRWWPEGLDSLIGWNDLHSCNY